MNYLKNKNDIQTEQLMFSGASVIFSSVKLFNKKLDDETLYTAINKCGYERITSNDYGYIEKIFISSGKNTPLMYDTKKSEKLFTIQLDENTFVTPVVRHHIMFFANKAVLVQSILVFDYNRITNTHCDITKIKRSLSVTDLLTIIHDIKKSSSDNGHAFECSIEDVFGSFSKQAGAPYTGFTKNVNFNEQNIAIQIWDIASLPDDCDRNNISGDYLESRYELDLTALLQLYNEHLTQNGLWKKLSSSQIKKAAEKKTDVLKDHRILISERICVEISQVNAPSIRKVSALRLQKYGYDSTSAFMWGILSIVEIGIKYCHSTLNNLYQQALQDDALSVDDLSKSMKKILLERDDYEFVTKMCIEDRHKLFLSMGYAKKGLKDYLSKISDIADGIQEMSNLVISQRTFATSDDIKALLNDLQAYTKEQDRSNDIISILSLILAITSIFSVAEYFANVLDIKSIVGNLITLLIVSLVFGLISVVIILKKKKNKQD